MNLGELNRSCLRILIADTAKEACSALRLFISQQAGYEVVGEVCLPDQLLEMVIQAEPNVLLVDWMMLGDQPSVMLASLHAVHPPLSVVVLSTRPEIRLQALQAGADDFVSKGDWPERMLTALAAREGLPEQASMSQEGETSNLAP